MIVFVMLAQLGRLVSEWAERQIDQQDRPLLEQIKDSWGGRALRRP